MPNTPSNTFLALYYIFIALAAVAAVIITVLFVYPIKPSHKVNYQEADRPLELDEVSAKYLQKVSFNKENQEFVFIRQPGVKKMVVSVAHKDSLARKKINVYNLDFSLGDVIAIPCKEEVEYFAAVVEGANGKKVKAKIRLRKSLIFAYLLFLIPSVFVAAAIFMYVILAAYYLADIWYGYASYYLFALFGLAPFVLGFASLFVVEYLVMKGGK